MFELVIWIACLGYENGSELLAGDRVLLGAVSLVSAAASPAVASLFGTVLVVIFKLNFHLLDEKLTTTLVTFFKV